MLQDLSSTEAVLGVSDQKPGDEVFSSRGDLLPVLLRELVLPLLDALKQHDLERSQERDWGWGQFWI